MKDFDKQEFDFYLKMYCSDNAKALELQEEPKYRGCRIWSFKRVVRKTRLAKNHPTYYELQKKRRLDDKFFTFTWNDIPAEEKETYIDEYWMALTNYDLEFEEDASSILRDTTREAAVYRLQGQIDKQYAEANATTDIL